jgi:hypothetical protein
MREHRMTIGDSTPVSTSSPISSVWAKFRAKTDTKDTKGVMLKYKCCAIGSIQCNPLRVLFTNRDNLVGGNVVSRLHNARRKRNLQMGNFRFKIQTEMRLLEIL